MSHPERWWSTGQRSLIIQETMKTRIRAREAPKIKHTPQRVQEVLQGVNCSSKKGVRKRTEPLNLKPSTCNKILTKEVKGLHPYRTQAKHLLNEKDKARRVQMCLDKVEHEPDWLDNLWFSDEAWFYLQGVVNSHSNVYWGTVDIVATIDDCFCTPLL